MDEELDRLLGISPRGEPLEDTEELDKLLFEGKAKTQPAREIQVAGEQDKELDRLLGGEEKPGYFEVLKRGLERNVADIRASVPQLQALYAETTGDVEGAVTKAAEAEEIRKAAPQEALKLDDIHDVEDFSLWLTEKFGENAATILATVATGGAGALAGNLAARGLLSAAGSRALSSSLAKGAAGRLGVATTPRGLATGAGGLAGAYAATSGLETAGTSSEQFEVTGSTQPLISVGAGLSKGALELATPFYITKAFSKAGLQLGSSIPVGVLKTAGLEGSTEALQESLDILARTYSDPEKGFLSHEPYWLGKEARSRLLEATTAGAALGGVIGGGAQYLERRQEAKKEGFQPRGERIEVGGDIGPVTRTMNMVKRMATAETAVGFGEGKREEVIDDPLLVTPLIRSVLGRWADVGVDPLTTLDMLEANTPRYVVEENGRIGLRVLTDTDLTLVTALQLPQEKRPKIVKVDQDSLQPVAISADVLDLPPPGSARIWFLPGIDSAEKSRLYKSYTEFYKFYPDIVNNVQFLNRETLDKSRASLEAHYSSLLSGGLRVVPSRGSSFYYNGSFKGEEVKDLSKTKRSKHIALYDPELKIYHLTNTPQLHPSIQLPPENRTQQELRTLTPPGVFGSMEFVGQQQGYVPVSIDLNKFAPGSISGIPQGRMPVDKMSGWRFRDGLSKEERRDLLREIKTLMPDADVTSLPRDKVYKFVEIIRKGIWYDPLDPFAEYRALVTLDPVERNKLTPGVFRQTGTTFSDMTAYHTGLKPGVKGKLFFHMPESTRTDYWTEEEYQLAKQIAEVVKKKLPLIQRLLKRLGLNEYDIYVSEAELIGKTDSESMGIIYLDEASVLISPKYFYKEYIHKGVNIFTGHLELDVTNVLLHEIGHGVTFQFFKRLPLEMQEKLLYAYEKMQLTLRMDREAGIFKTSMIGDPGRPGTQAWHHSSFSEWATEQFRRWALRGQDVTNQVESEFYDIGQKLENFYRQWENKVAGGRISDLYNPDYYFSDIMQYLKRIGEIKTTQEQRANQQKFYMLAPDIEWSETANVIVNQMIEGLKSLNQTFPEEVNTKFLQTINETPNIYGRFVKNAMLIEAAIASMPSEQTFEFSRVFFSHELVHAYIELGLLSDTEAKILLQSMKDEGLDLAEDIKRDIRVSADKLSKEWRFDEQTLNNLYNSMLQEERIAYYVSSFANTGIAKDAARPILQRILELWKRTVNYLRGLGFTSREDILRAFFKGEMVTRERRFRRTNIQLEQLMRSESGDTKGGRTRIFDPVKIVKVEDGIWAAADYITTGYQNELVTYYFYADPAENTILDPDPYKAIEQLGAEIGYVNLDNKGYKGWEVGMVYSHDSKRVGLPKTWSAQKFYDFIEKDLKTVLSPSGILTKEGYDKIWKVRQPEAVRWHIYDKEDALWYSPNTLKKKAAFFEALHKSALANKSSGLHVERTKEQALKYKELFKKVDPLAWKDPRINYMHMVRRNVARDGVQGSIVKAATVSDENALLKTIDGENRGGEFDSFKRGIVEERVARQTERAEQQKEPFDQVGYPSAPTMEMRRLFKAVLVPSSGVSRTYWQNILDEADSLIKFSKYFIGLQQFAWVHETFPRVRSYLSKTEEMTRDTMRWLTRADETARAWESQLSSFQKESITELLFWLTEMKYRAPGEIAADIIRQPYPAELKNKMTALKFTPEMENLYQRIRNDFTDFITEVETWRVGEIDRIFASDPAGRARALAELNKEMAQIRSKPYFPMTRFGEYTISVKDGGKLLWYSAYATASQRDAALSSIKSKFAGRTIIAGRVPESAIEFQGLPAPLIRAIRTSMPGLTPSQQVWLEEFELQNLPDSTFRKRWITRTGVPGYSMDSFRTYAQYFMHGAHYLAKLKYKNELQNIVNGARREADNTPTRNERLQIIANYMQSHLNYMMKGGRDWSKFKAFISLWQLGFSPAAALMNLTQIPTVLYPFLGKQFGDAATTKAMLQATNALKEGYGGVVKGPGQYNLARIEMMRQGRIDAGQAPQLGAFAEGSNLTALLAGTKAQKAYRNLSYYGMWMFGAVERWNREYTMHAAWRLALANPNIKRLTDIDLLYPNEVADLMSRVNLSHSEALAFLFAKEAIDKTQFVYAPYARPRFLQSAFGSTVLIFYQYTQGMLYALAMNPGSLRMLFILAALYGMMGLPGAEDFNELLQAVARRLFGKDFDIKDLARKHVRDITKGTVFDEVGPDLFLHGISRYSFGLGLLPEWTGRPRFDASLNGSLGHILPGFSEGMRQVANFGDWKNFTADVGQRAAGAGFGMGFSLLQYLMESPGTVDSKKWEALLPRAARAEAKAYRYATKGETTHQGAQIVKFDIKDPDDLTTILTQALGFTPTKVSETWDSLRADRDEANYYKTLRGILYAQMDAALRSDNKAAEADVTKAIEAFNKRVKNNDNVEMSIRMNDLRTSLKARARGRSLQEAFVPASRRESGIRERTLDLYPGVLLERKKVR